MGMSASQSRLLSLTARLSDLEFEAQSISNSKIRLADASAEASNNYLDALNKEKLTVYSGNTASYIDATAYNLTTYAAVSTTDKQRFLVDASNRVLLTTATAAAFNNSNSHGINFTNVDGSATYNNLSAQTIQSTYTDVNSFLQSMGVITDNNATGYNAATVNYYTSIYSGLEGFLQNLGYTSNPDNEDSTLNYDSGAESYYANVYGEIQENGYNSPGDENMRNSEWLYTQLSNGNIYLQEWNTTGGDDGTGGWEKVSWSSGDATVQTKSDDTETAKAEAEYETTMARIQSQDKRFDLQLESINTEHTAIQTEIDSVKKVIDKNIERSFKIFDA